MTSLEIENQKSQIPENKSYGLYSCPIYILKLSKSIVSCPLVIMINMSIENGLFPSKLKTAKIVPILKSADQTDPDNYRPISLSSIFNRIYENIMYNRLISSVINTTFYQLHSMVSESNIARNMPLSTLLIRYIKIWIIKNLLVPFLLI